MPDPVATTADTAGAQKARSTFFTPDAITRYVSDWAIRDSHDTVLEPSAGDAAFLVQAVQRLREHGSGPIGSSLRRSEVSLTPHQSTFPAAPVSELSRAWIGTVRRALVLDAPLI